MRTTPNRRSRLASLRFRLVGWNVLAIVVTAVVTLVGTREGVRLTLVHELDVLLREDLQEIELSVQGYGGSQSKAFGEQLDRKAEGHAHSKWFAQLTDAQGQVVYRSSQAPDEAVLAAAGPSPRTVGIWRILTRTMPSSDLTVQTGASLESIHADIVRLDRWVVIAALLVLLLGPVCGYWLALRTTRPLDRIIVTMAHLRPSRLDERLEIRGTGDELDRLAITFNRLLDRVGEYLQERRDFVANAAHELRTPLAAIRSSVEVALTNGRSRREYEELLREILEESSSLEILINQLLLLSETDAERLKTHQERVRLDQLVERAMDMFGGVAEFREVQLACPALPAVEVFGTRQHLQQVIYNLLDNALKFTAEGGLVQIQLRPDGDHAIFSVSNNGPQIPAEDLPHVFDRFFRGDRTRSNTTEPGGNGLGLSICHSIVRAHAGTIVVDSNSERTQFIVRLPLANGEHNRSKERDESRTDLSREPDGDGQRCARGPAGAAI